MTHRFVSVVAAFVVALAFSGTAAELEKTAVTAAESWLVLVDGGKHEESWQVTGIWLLH